METGEGAKLPDSAQYGTPEAEARGLSWTA